MRPCMLMLVADAARRCDVRLAWQVICPAGAIMVADNASDAALQAMTHPATVLVLEDGFAGASPALLRHFRRQWPRARMLVFSDSPRDAHPPVRPWSELMPLLCAVVSPRKERIARSETMIDSREGSV